MNIDLKVPATWRSMSHAELRHAVETVAAAMEQKLDREQTLLLLFCRLAGVTMVEGTAKDGKGETLCRFTDSQQREFTLTDWQLKDFCQRLAFVIDEDASDIDSPIGVNRHLMDATFIDYFRADSHMYRHSLTEDPQSVVDAARALGYRGPLDPTDTTLMVLWWNCLKEWMRGRYPKVFAKVGGDSEAYSPVEARRNIMLMLNEGHPQENEDIDNSNVHDVLASIQYRIEDAQRAKDYAKRTRQ